MKVKYPLDSTLRKQLADTLKYLRRSKQMFIKRRDVESSVDTIYDPMNLQELLEGISPEDYSSVFIRGGSQEDYDGYDEGYIELYSFRKQTDEEYFYSICAIVLPTAYQHKQYEDYLRLKSMFEK